VREVSEPKPGLATRAVHAGEATDPHTRSHATPIYQTATFAFESADAMEARVADFEHALAGVQAAVVTSI
jgi:O-acetylhomoserine/O-acetylserine sulfhydrylase-like pyridoxal-dependent enzyme